MDTVERLKKWLCPPDEQTMRTVLIYGPPESGKTTAAVSLAEWVLDYYAGIGKPGEMFFLDGDRRIPRGMKAVTLRDVVEKIRRCDKQVLVVGITDPGKTLALDLQDAAGRRQLANLIDKVWQARHINRNLQHFVFILASQTLSGITRKLRALGLLTIVKACTQEDLMVLEKRFGMKKARSYLVKLTEAVFTGGDKSLGIVIFPQKPWGFIRFPAPKLFSEMRREEKEEAEEEAEEERWPHVRAFLEQGGSAARAAASLGLTRSEFLALLLEELEELLANVKYKSVDLTIVNSE
ncbi:MAG: hypothetical protein ACTSWP_10855 [Candidatus Freyarchaeota archaeon]